MCRSRRRHPLPRGQHVSQATLRGPVNSCLQDTVCVCARGRVRGRVRGASVPPVVPPALGLSSACTAAS